MSARTPTTRHLRPQDVTHDWYVVDAQDVVLGRLASQLARILRGKHKPTFSPHLDCGDRVVVVNAEKVALTGHKRQTKEYFRHTGYPGGIRRRTAAELLDGKRPALVIQKAVEKMMTDGPLSRVQMKGLYVYAGPEHPHAGQRPKPLSIRSINDKNTVAGPRRSEIPKVTATTAAAPAASWQSNSKELLATLVLGLDGRAGSQKTATLFELARLLTLPDGKAAQGGVAMNDLASLPDKLLDALVETGNGGDAGKAAALALVCYLYPQRWRDVSPQKADEVRLAADLSGALRERGFQYFTSAHVTNRAKGRATVVARVFDRFRFRLAGKPVDLDPPAWLRANPAIKMVVSGARMLRGKALKNGDGMLSGCLVEVAPLAEPPDRAAVYLMHEGFVFDRFFYDYEELFGSPEASHEARRKPRRHQ